ncbi:MULTISPECIES: hypothetical protein [unclassified Rhodococcus (in: high G+C Gram-positive bacteria)]|uniref:hypothetical protein n=1 Tax=unclassified Rhodococcus (in: high G+C Gram-positive bacteria) TaxID=192944 RepID=UPI001AEA2570|nr:MULTISPECIES: hypothetical protein [unclassified Rhodococcus (in: high G+C Gram-positive bacteria)]MBP2523603.1 hypothetical protein [Rhodococcus sp. PvP104]MDA3634721.1 hypothetical protein [Rhodococcus sp. C-2]
MSMPEEIHQICAPQDFSRCFAAIAHAKRRDIEGVQVVIDEANERNRLAELTFASLFALADIFKAHMGDEFEKQMVDLAAHAASFGDITLSDDEG